MHLVIGGLVSGSTLAIVPFALVATAAGAGELLARLAPVLLGPTPAERLAAAEEHARTLAERNRLARELHDSRRSSWSRRGSRCCSRPRSGRWLGGVSKAARGGWPGSRG
ncbi:hypothetical protein ACIBQ1_34395 [Nonomuraea sp. NPDC050153]|uniref:hypothetical protein n=1 Tax=Nonomuraea sp. NPDC050153 TaxID=3364359 RepID=UPI0037A613DB